VCCNKHIDGPLYSNIFPVKSLIKKHIRAIKDEKESQLVFQELDSSLDHSTRQQWSQEEDLAITLRGDYLKIYQVRAIKSESKANVILMLLRFPSTISASRGVQSNTPSTSQLKSDPKNASWLSHGLKVEQKQYVICA
jgi:hypothetical protein